MTAKNETFDPDLGLLAALKLHLGNEAKIWNMQLLDMEIPCWTQLVSHKTNESSARFCAEQWGIVLINNF